VTVSDDGPGIAAERVSDVLPRGARLDTSGSGAGLGLAIVTDIVDAWNGRLSFDNGSPGLIVTMRLPQAPAV